MTSHRIRKPKKFPSFHALQLRELSLSVHLGCEKEERVVPQEVRVSVELRFAKAPKAVTTDELTDSVCYAQISEGIRAKCEAQGMEYRLIERMAYDIYDVVREIAGSGTKIGVIVHKVRPPVENLRGGSVFCCGDFAL